MGDCGEVTNPPGVAPTLVAPTRHRNVASTQETLGELLEALIAFLARTRENARDVRMKPRLAPAVSSRLFRVAGGALARALEQRQGGGGIELGVVAGGKGEAAMRATAGVLVDEGAGHFSEVVEGVEVVKVIEERTSFLAFLYVDTLDHLDTLDILSCIHWISLDSMIRTPG